MNILSEKKSIYKHSPSKKTKTGKKEKTLNKINQMMRAHLIQNVRKGLGKIPNFLSMNHSNKWTRDGYNSTEKKCQNENNRNKFFE